MAERKWISPRLFAQYEGDWYAAQRLERRARICVGYLFDQLRPGQTYRVQTWNYNDGSRIKAHVWRDVLGERARVEIFAPELGGETFETFWYFESGALSSDLKVYLSEDQFEYFHESQGTLLLPESKYVFLNGKFFFPVVENNQAIWGSVETQTGIEAAASNYQSQGIKALFSSTDVDPDFPYATSGLGSYSISSVYTGLLRLAVQAKLARGTDFLEDGGFSQLFPWGIGPPFVGSYKAYKHCGLIRSQEYNYYMVRVTDSVCTACRMEFSNDVVDLKNRLAAELLTDDDRIKLEAILMSGLRPAYIEVDGVLVLDETELLSFEAPTEVWWHFAYGWHFNYSAPFECAIVEHNTTFYDSYPDTVGSCSLHQARRRKITFTFSEDPITGEEIISAQLATELAGDLWKNYPDSTTIWHPDEFHYLMRPWWAKGCTIDEAHAPLYGWYQPDGYHEVWINLQETDLSEIHIPPLADRLTCKYPYAIPTYSARYLGGTSRISYTIDAPDEFEEDLVEFDGENWNTNFNPNNDSWQEYTGTYEVEQDKSYQYIYKAGSYGAVARWTESCPDYYPTEEAERTYYEMRLSIIPTPEGECKVTEYNKNLDQESFIPPYSIALIIPRSNAECVAILTRNSRKASYVTTYEPSEELIFFSGIALYYWDAILVNGALVPTTLRRVDDVNCGFRVTGAPYAAIGKWAFTSYGTTPPLSNRLGVTKVSREEVNISEQTATATLVCQSAQTLTPEQSLSFTGYFNILWNEGRDAIRFAAPASYTGHLRYPLDGHDDDERALYPTFADSEIIAPRNFLRWIGWV